MFPDPSRLTITSLTKLKLNFLFHFFLPRYCKNLKMAVEFVIGVVAENLLNKLLSLGAEEIRLFIGCKESLESLKNGDVKIIQDLIADAHNKDIKSMAVQSWFKRLNAVLFDAENVFEEYNYKLLRQTILQTEGGIKVRSFFSPVKNFAFRHKIAHKVKAISSELKLVSDQGREYGLFNLLNTCPEVKMNRVGTSPAVQEADIVGRDDDVAKVVNMLVSANNEENIALTAIVGMGGQGKTTLAKLVYKHNNVVTHFEKKVWVCVSDDFKIERLLSDMVQSLTKENPNLTTRESLILKLQDTLKGKRYLVVFDDVWNVNQQKWDEMKNDLLEISGSKGTKILVTTRSKEVVSIMRAQTHDLNKLSDEDSWSLFKKRAFAEGGVVEAPEFVAIGQMIIKRCCGVPLAIKVLGGLLYSKKDISEWWRIEKSDIWSSTNLQGENQEPGVLSCIKLSYDHLTSFPLKQCFAYCSIFPKDTELERERLIEQWMAHGFLNPPKGSNLQMEDVGSNYLDILLWNSLLQEPCYDEYYKTWSYKMHDIVHDFALKISKDYCFMMTEESQDVNDIVKAVHVSLLTDIPKEISSKIRTLRLCLPKGVESSNINVLSKFGHLRSLILSAEGVEELPTSIRKLKLLRNLDIQASRIRTLPDSYIKLYNLQTLRLPSSFEQEVLYVGTLVNLRHIYISVASYMFYMSERYMVERCIVVGIKQLVHLQRLPPFIVSNEKGCNIDELENLNNLGGSLCICGLDEVKNGEEARKANISKKVKIHHLELRWSDSSEREAVVNEEDVLEGLIPHSFLKTLTIQYFKGLRFPSWMTTANSRLLINLMEIQLVNCDLVEQLPPLGHLPNLRKIKICGLKNVKRIGAEFYGCTDDLNSTSCAFPALEELWIYWMSNLEEWLGVEQLSPSLQAFPHLSILNVCDCDLPSLTSLSSLTELLIGNNERLTELPSLEGLTSLKKLSIRGNEKLTELSSLTSLSSLTELSIENNERLTELPSLECLTSLTDLSIYGNEKLTELPSLEGLTSLTDLSIENNERLTELPSLEGFTSLKQLSISQNEKLTELPIGIQSCTSLEIVKYSSNKTLPRIDVLERLPNLRKLEIGGGFSEIDLFPWPHKYNNNEDNHLYFGSLTSLTLRGGPKITSLPEQIQYLPSLTSLTIIKFDGLEALPEWLGNIHSLSSLHLWKNENLKYMPSAEAMKRLTNLQELKIKNCPHLEERCTRGSGPEWHKISHIQTIKVNYYRI